ncbi:MAG TPA: M3 family metallopeptidase, partial [Ktedonobacteraceae bacterium]|nr:M3 family metallopeptidase [Ktedonobacteraceae bacterium]
MTTTQSLPHWDMSVVYPSLDSPEFAQGFAHTIENIADLVRLFDEHHIMQQPALAVDGSVIHTLETVFERYNAVADHIRTIVTYISCFVSTNSRDNTAQARMSELQQHMVQWSFLATRLTAWLGSLDIEALIERSATARNHAYMLRRAKVQAQHLMSPAEEILATELDVSGGTAWARLHSNLTSQLQVRLEIGGQVQELPMSAIRNLAFDADREVRRQAYEAELEAWKQAALPLAAALNSIKGQVNVLTRSRGWESPLAAALFNNNIDRQTLDAMFAAARQSFPDFRRYLRAKAHALHLPRLAWYDLFAPVGSSNRVWEYDNAAAFIVEQFGTYSSKLANFAARAFREHWIDAEPRPGKRDGAYCTSLRKDESRVFANFKPAFGGMSTLAHELGHGYHNLNLAQRTALQRQTPMTLAETASIFCETIIRQAALQKADKQEQIVILEAAL